MATCELLVEGAGGGWDSGMAVLVDVTVGCNSCLGAGAGSAFTEVWVP